jgi:hypothetical protein
MIRPHLQILPAIFGDECSQRLVLFCIFKVLNYRDIFLSATVPDEHSELFEVDD